MGLFSKKKKEDKEKTYKELLVSVGINLESFNYEDYEPEEISIDDELAGITRKSGKVFEGEAEYNIIDFSEDKDGKKELSLAKYADEYAMKDLVNKFNSVFGPDDDFNAEFTSEDLNTIRKSSFNTIRKWVSDVNSEYNITLSYSSDDGMSNIYIF